MGAKARQCRGQRPSRAFTEPQLVLVSDVGDRQPLTIEVAKVHVNPEVE
jgi:hypothetical protein